MIIAAADGSALNNPGPAGWAWFIDENNWAADGWADGTNNQGELKAVLNLLLATEGSGEPLKILCDSQYVINTVTKWMPGWKRKGWKKADGKPVLNLELVKALDEALVGRQVQFEWVKGHSGHSLNEAADERARGAATAVQQGREVNRGPGFQGTWAAQATTTEPGSEPEEGQLDLFSGAFEQASEPAKKLAACPETSSEDAPKPLATPAKESEMKLTFIGCGNMGEAMLAGALRASVVKPADVRVNTHTEATMSRLAEKYGIKAEKQKAKAVAGADVVVIATEPSGYPEVLAEIAPAIAEDALVVSVTPAYSIDQLRGFLGSSGRIVRTMPNMPAQIGKGVTGVVFEESVDASQRDTILGFLESFGAAFEVREDKLGAVTALAGSAPAFIYMFISAMADAGVDFGMTRAQALQIATATVEGSAAYVRERDYRVADLLEGISSPGGTTIRGIIEMQKSGVPAGIIESMRAIVARYNEMNG